MTTRARHGDAAASVAGSRPIRVCHVVATHQGAGWMVEQLRELRDRFGNQPASIVTSLDSPVADHLRAEGIPVAAADFDFNAVPEFRNLLRRVLALAWRLRRSRFDVVQTSLWHSVLVGRLAAWLADVPVRLTMAVGHYHLDAPIPRWIEGSTCWMDTGIICIAQYIADCYRELGVPRDRTWVVYIAKDLPDAGTDSADVADLRGEFGWAPDTPLIGMVAWFYPPVSHDRWAPEYQRGMSTKGHEDAIWAARRVVDTVPNARVLFIGDGTDERGARYVDELRALVAELGLQDHVIFAGARTDIPAVYRALDVAIFPSRNEACGGTIEALMEGCPCVGNRVGGIPDMLVDCRTGLLVERGRPDQLAAGVIRLLHDRELAQRLGKAGREHVKQVASFPRMVSALDEIYRGCLYEEGQRRAGYRAIVSMARLPIVVLVCAYLHIRLYVWENRYRAPWQAGWRPWPSNARRRLPRIRAWQINTWQINTWQIKTPSLRPVRPTWMLPSHPRLFYWQWWCVCTWARVRGHTRACFQQAVSLACRVYIRVRHGAPSMTPSS